MKNSVVPRAFRQPGLTRFVLVATACWLAFAAHLPRTIAATINGAIGNATHPAWLTLQFASGGLTLNNGVTLHGCVTAPAGAVVINGNSTLHGRVISDSLTIDSQGLLDDLGL